MFLLLVHENKILGFQHHTAANEAYKNVSGFSGFKYVAQFFSLDVQTTPNAEN